ncbi:putative Holliday junction resolvase [Aneurinibacillus soli]|uniref:Putative pre-16S rRNA nuclease n=1 Tax=Aneurinibacillus soli TaxID=1500254 RepID=A0A0U5ATH4_9BACL|nr:Holliday junction resolvase RuvX [Aneurinibacillus soli]PYE62494.1 putative Holliday junction resolvase [Aneurinibacillus soli]BAU27057.1 putative Holliday junction resolvase [Aneurinibacillus soli]
MRRMGLDVGDKTIGVAVSDELGFTAQGIETIRREGKKKDYLRLEELIKQYEIGEIIVGLPKNMNGTIGPRGELCQAFGEYVHNRSRIPVVMWDERLTTMAAERTLLEADVSRKKRKQVIDKMAAVMILQNYMDAKPQIGG